MLRPWLHVTVCLTIKLSAVKCGPLPILPSPTTFLMLDESPSIEVFVL